MNRITLAMSAIALLASLAIPSSGALAQFATDVQCAQCVGTGDIAFGAVRQGRIADGAVTNRKIAPGAVTNGRLAANAVGSAKIADGTIANADIADATITAAKLAFVAGGGGGPLFVAFDNNSAEIGPVTNGPSSENIIVLATVGANDYLLRLQYEDNNNSDPSDDYYEIRRQSQYVYYTTSNDCSTGSTHVDANSFLTPIYFGAYSIGMIGGVSGAGQARILWKVDSFSEISVAVMSRKRGSTDACEDITDTSLTLIPVSIASSNLASVYPTPFTIVEQ